MRVGFGGIAAFLAMNLAGALIAMMMNPFVRVAFGPMIRDPDRDGLHVPALLGGYAVISIVFALLHGRLTNPTVRTGTLLGLLLGLAVFLGGHLVVAGWSTMPAGAMAASGAFDALAVSVGGAAYSLVTMGQGAREHVRAH